MNTDSPESSSKAQIDALLLKLPGASTRKINPLNAYFVTDKMFGYISGRGFTPIYQDLPSKGLGTIESSSDGAVHVFRLGLGGCSSRHQEDPFPPIADAQ